MQVTNVTIKLIQDRPRLKALASITLDDGLVIHAIKVVQTNKRLCAEFPSPPHSSDFEYVAPINEKTRHLLESAILSAYEKQRETEKTAV